MRVCPTVDGSSSPLITHRIRVCDCLGRQQSNYHKCFRCIYRGMAADWQPPLQPGEGGAVMTPAGARGVPTVKVGVPTPPAPRKGNKGKADKADKAGKGPKRRTAEPTPASPAG